MKKICLALFFLLTVSANFLYGWGDEGHKLIAEKGLHSLPAKMQNFSPWFDFVIAHSTDPDTRKSVDKTEGNKHFIDIDYYSEYKNGKFETNIDSLTAKYGKDMVTKQGTLPWAIQNTFQALVDAFKSHNTEKAKVMMSDLAHYVGDAHQPMHTTVNYNGQLTEQKGVHARYEIEMIAKNYAELVSRLHPANGIPIKNLKDFTFNIISESNSLLPVVMTADKTASEISHKEFNADYYRLMWFYTQYVTVDAFNKASERLASIYYSAWIQAGSPAYKLFKK